MAHGHPAGHWSNREQNTGPLSLQEVLSALNQAALKPDDRGPDKPPDPSVLILSIALLPCGFRHAFFLLPLSAIPYQSLL